MLVHVESSYFVAGLELDEDTGVCVRAAPILKWCLGKHYRDIRPEFRARGFKAKNMGCDGIRKELPGLDRGYVRVNGRQVSPRSAARAFAGRMLGIAEKHHGLFRWDDAGDGP